MTLVDPFGRKVTGLRIAITSRCNMRCIYCHHEGETSPGEEMSKETVVQVVKAGADLGIKSVKFTGGEPLMRSDLEDILNELPGHLSLSLTTNGTLLAGRASSLAEAGLDRLNVSLDTLNPRIYSEITGGTKKDLDRVMEGIRSARDAGLTPIKLNMVVLRENQDEVDELIEFAKEEGAILQLIELLDLEGIGLGGDLLNIEKDLERRSDRIVTRHMHRRRKYFLDGAEVEVVRPIDNTEFCANCTRLRVTSDGKLKPCLLRNDNLVEIGSADFEETKLLLREATARRKPYFLKSSLLKNDG